MDSLKEIIKRKTVNSNNKYLTTVNSKETVDTVNSKSINEKVQDLLDEERITPEGVAQLLAEELDDLDSLGYYILLAKENIQPRLLEAMHLTLEADKLGKIRTKKAIYYQAILRNWGFKTKFRKQKDE